MKFIFNFILLGLILTTSKPALALFEAPTFCSAMEGERENIDAVLKSLNILQTGYKPHMLDGNHKSKAAEK